MNKKKKGRKLSLQRNQRRALLKGLAENLILKERIRTTRARAKELSSFLEKEITAAKKQDLASAKRAHRLFSPKAAEKLHQELGARFAPRPGGYTRLLRLPRRASDQAELVFVELIK